MPHQKIGKKSRPGGDLDADVLQAVKTQCEPGKCQAGDEDGQERGKNSLNATGIETTETERSAVEIFE
jgi:hypothetical protein